MTFTDAEFEILTNFQTTPSMEVCSATYDLGRDTWGLIAKGCLMVSGGGAGQKARIWLTGQGHIEWHKEAARLELLAGGPDAEVAA